MREIELALPAVWLSDAGLLADRLEAECLSQPLRITLKSTLKSFSGCTHWHFKHIETKQAGTLELTWWPARQRAWFKIAAGRAGAWQMPVMAALHEKLRAAATSVGAEPDRWTAAPKHRPMA